MKAISLFKLLTLVCFFVVSFQYEAKAETKQECELRVFNATKTACNSEADPVKKAACISNARSDASNAAECASLKTKEEEQLARRVETACAREQWKRSGYSDESTCRVCVEDPQTPFCTSAKDKENSCKDLLSKYDDGAKKTTEECARLGEENAAKCVAKAQSCSKGLDAFADPGSAGEDSTADALVNLIGVYGRMRGANAGANGQSVAGCVIENSDSEADKEERLDEKITNLREKITELRNEKPAAEDEKLNEKRQDVEAKMLEARQENEKAQHEAKTENQKTAARLAEDIIKFNDKKRQRAIQVAELNDQIAKVTEEVQKIALTMADSLIQTQCRKSKKEYYTKALDDKKKAGTKFTNTELKNLEEETKEVEVKCLQLAAREKQDAINAKNRQKRSIQRSISNIESQTASEAQTMANKQKEIENLKALASEKEKKDLENLTTKLNNLNKSVTDLEAAVERRKKGFEEKAKALEDQINKILQDRQNVKAKFAKVYSTASSGGASARAFVSQCCATDRRTGGDTSRTTVKGFAEACTRVRTDYDIKDAAVPRSRPSTGR